jgi:hypothetical protein
VLEDIKVPPELADAERALKEIRGEAIEMAQRQLDTYNQQASTYCKAAIFIWCLVGWIYAAITWHILWLPAMLILFPGIFVASLIAAAFFIPLWTVVKKAKDEWQNYERKKWNLLVAGTILKIGIYLGPLAGAVLYVHVLRTFMK